MSKCIICGKELLSGDGLWEQGVCNHCYDEKTIKQYPFKQGIIAKDQQLAELKAENERLKKYETIYYLNQLQASNEDIDKFKHNQIQQSINISDLLKDNTKQVCEKIRDYITSNEKDEYDYYNDEFSGRYTVNVKDLNKFLNQIEKGE